MRRRKSLSYIRDSRLRKSSSVYFIFRFWWIVIIASLGTKWLSIAMWPASMIRCLQSLVVTLANGQLTCEEEDEHGRTLQVQWLQERSNPFECQLFCAFVGHILNLRVSLYADLQVSRLRHSGYNMKRQHMNCIGTPTSNASTDSSWLEGGLKNLYTASMYPLW